MESGHIADSQRRNLRWRNLRCTKGASKLESAGIRRCAVEARGIGAAQGNEDLVAIFSAHTRRKDARRKKSNQPDGGRVHLRFRAESVRSCAYPRVRSRRHGRETKICRGIESGRLALRG